MTETTKSNDKGTFLSEVGGALRKTLISQIVPNVARNAFLSLLGTKVQTLLVTKDSDSNFRNSLTEALESKTLDIRATYGVVRRKEFIYLNSYESTASTSDDVLNGWWLVKCDSKYIVIRKCNLLDGEAHFNTTLGLPTDTSSTKEIFSWYVLYYSKDDPSAYEYLVKRFSEDLKEYRKNRAIVVYSLTQQGSPAMPEYRWQHKTMYRPAWNEKCPIVIPEFIKKNLIDDAALWKTRDQWYADRKIPYQRSYMLDGPPGSGKSTLIPELAYVVGMDVYLVNLSLIESDAHLDEVFSKVRSAILVIEDADSFEVLRSRTAPPLEGADQERNKTKITLSGFLNAINGVGAENNRIIVYTTNHSEHLDPAVTRSGRVDRTLHVGPLHHSDIVAYGAGRYTDWQTPPDVTFAPTKVCDLQRFLIESGDDVNAFISRIPVEGVTEGELDLPSVLESYQNAVGNMFYLEVGHSGSGIFAPYELKHVDPAMTPEGYMLTLESEYMASQGRPSVKKVCTTNAIRHSALPKGGKLYKRSDKA